ncbi:hypothetical protein HDU91_000660 [Kappamyces sp. JEL0680]|nr:hypothetical protein HDU91_000660 [Kappamyces sp. JEL0680]
MSHRQLERRFPYWDSEIGKAAIRAEESAAQPRQLPGLLDGLSFKSLEENTLDKPLGESKTSDQDAEQERELRRQYNRFAAVHGYSKAPRLPFFQRDLRSALIPTQDIPFFYSEAIKRANRCADPGLTARYSGRLLATKFLDEYAGWAEHQALDAEQRLLPFYTALYRTSVHYSSGTGFVFIVVLESFARLQIPRTRKFQSYLVRSMARNGADDAELLNVLEKMEYGSMAPSVIELIAVAKALDKSSPAFFKLLERIMHSDFEKKHAALLLLSYFDHKGLDAVAIFLAIANLDEAILQHPQLQERLLAKCSSAQDAIYISNLFQRRGLVLSAAAKNMVVLQMAKEPETQMGALAMAQGELVDRGEAVSDETINALALIKPLSIKWLRVQWQIAAASDHLDRSIVYGMFKSSLRLRDHDTVLGIHQYVVDTCSHEAATDLIQSMLRKLLDPKYCAPQLSFLIWSRSPVHFQKRKASVELFLSLQSRSAVQNHFEDFLRAIYKRNCRFSGDKEYVSQVLTKMISSIYPVAVHRTADPDGEHLVVDSEPLHAFVHHLTDLLVDRDLELELGYRFKQVLPPTSRK